MNPLVLALVQVLIQYGPSAYAAVVELVHTTNPTKADFETLLKSFGDKSYDDYIAEAKAAHGGA
jgi:nucleoside diphosphate kinase